jgi:hypothetical protein
MINVVYPALKPKIKIEDGREFIFCVIRKRWLTITPEEWVRQNFILYFTEVLHYSKSLIAVEKQIRVGELDKRFDIVIYGKDTRPWIVTECKEPGVNLSGITLQQVLHYNIHLAAPYLCITNGNYTFAFKNEGVRFAEISEFPVGS